MKIEDVKLGMKVRANEKSNERYNFTTEKNGCEGEVVALTGNKMKITVTGMKAGVCIGKRYDVEPAYFDAIGEEDENKETLAEEELKQTFMLSCIEDTTGFEPFKFDDISNLDIIISTLEVTKEEKMKELMTIMLQSAKEFADIQIASEKHTLTDELRIKAIATQLQLKHIQVTKEDIEEQITNLKKLRDIITK